MSMKLFVRQVADQVADEFVKHSAAIRSRSGSR
jgi:hypothetical protein